MLRASRLPGEYKQMPKETIKLPVNHEKLSITERKQVREEYILRQKGLCYFCKNSLYEKPTSDILSKRIDITLFPKNFFIWPIHLHHSHSTGMTLGAVHSHCNAVLWQYYGE